MNDVAKAANKSRRTLYTYFLSKEQLLEASIEMEVKKISTAVTKVAMSNLPADKKIIKLVFVRLQMTRSIVRRNGCMHSDYLFIVEHIRKTFDAKEIALFRHIITEGNQKGLFNSESPDLAARFLHFCLKGIEMPFINGIINRNNDDKFVYHFTEKVILSALGHTSTTDIQK
jgi:AcrR family transcriptional regulator